VAVILGLHGIANQQLGRQQILRLWQPALGDGLERASGLANVPPEMDLVFYGDLFLKSANLDDIDDEEVSDLVTAARDVVTDSDIAEAERQPDKAYTRVPRPLQAVAGAIGRKFGAAAVVLFFGDVRQVRRYLWHPEIRAEVDRRTATAFSPDCRVLIGHSLGSVVAYEFARQHPDRTVPMLVTLGSPLGLKFIRRRLAELAGTKEPPMPPGVGQWVNVYDPRDPVACAGPLKRWWPAVEDRDVDNGGDSHDATRYLGKRKTGSAVRAGLTVDV
jgi:hypothetical protein